MLVGFNTNIPYKGKVYHVQTEDTGANSLIISLLYYKGAILASRKTSYTHLRDGTDYEEKVRELMKDQHKNLIKELINGKISGQAEGTESVVGKEEAEDVQKYKSLDDILIDHILRQVGKK